MRYYKECRSTDNTLCGSSSCSAALGCVSLCILRADTLCAFSGRHGSLPLRVGADYCSVGRIRGFSPQLTDQCYLRLTDLRLTIFSHRLHRFHRFVMTDGNHNYQFSIINYQFLVIHYNLSRMRLRTTWAEISRLAASGMTRERGPSMTSSVTMRPRRTGRQCMK